MEDQDELEEQFQEQKEQDNSVIRTLREKAKRGEAAEKELEALKAQVASQDRNQQFQSTIAKLGIEPEREEKFRKLAEKFVEGDPDEASLRGLATDYGFLTEDTKATEEAHRQEQMSQLHQGASVVMPGTPAELNQRISEAKTPEEVMALARQAGVPIHGE